MERKAGSRYKVSPFQLLINDGNYYLIAYADYAQEIRTYRVDRIKDIRFTGEPRDGDEEFKQIDVKSYAYRVFSMMRGEPKLVQMRFANFLLDAVVDRFGTRYVQYAKVDEEHFSVTAKIEVSDQFYGWLLGFGDNAKLVYPEDAVENFRGYLRKVGALYEG